MRAAFAPFPAFIKVELDPSSGQAFAEFETAARSTADRAKDYFETSFRDVQRIARDALTMPRTQGGALDLDVGKYRQAAAAAEQQAVALRQIATAAAAAAVANRDDSEATRLYVQAARAAAIEAEQGARAANQQATAIDRLQTELNQTAAANRNAAASTVVLNNALGRSTTGFSGNRMAMIQASQQVQDFAVQVAAGASPLIAFAQQGSQLAYVLSGVGGTAGRFASLMSGPVGTSLLLVTTLLGPLAAGLFRQRDGHDAAAAGAEAHKTAVELLREAQREIITTGQLAEAMTLRQAQADLAAASAARARTAELLRQAIAVEQLAIARANDPLAGDPSAPPQTRIAGADLPGARGRVQALERRLAAMDRDIAAGEQRVRIRQLPIIQRGVNERLDPGARVRGEFERTQNRLNTQLARGRIGADEYAAALTRATRARDAELEVIQQAERTGRRSSRDSREVGRIMSVDEARDIVASIGGRVTSGTRDRATQQRLYDDYRAGRGPLAARPGTSAHERGNAVDIVGATVAEVRRAFRERGVNLSRIFTETNPRTGARHVHAEWSRSASAEVMGEADDRARELAQDLEAVSRAFDGARVAADEYAATLARISRLEAAGAITGADALGFRLAAAAQRSRELAEAEERRWREILGPDDFSRVVDGVAEQWSDRMADGSREAADELRRQGLEAVEAVSSLFGRRAAGIGNLVAEAMFSNPAATRVDAGAFGGLGGIINLFERERSARQVREMSDAERAAAGPDPYVFNPVIRGLRGVFDPLADALRGFTRQLGNLIGGGGDFLGQMIAFGGIGSSAARMAGGSGLAGALGGALGGIGGKVAERAINASLASMGQRLIPGIAGPLGSVVGGLAASVLAGSLRSTPRASSTIRVGADGRLAVASTTGTRKLRGATVEAADSAISTIERIAEALGGSVLSGVGSVSIGMRKGSYRVDPSGSGKTKLSKGAIDFGEDAEAAVRAATLDLIRDGIIGGLRASTQRLLQGAKDLDAGIEKAVRFESVFQRLKEHLDPLGAALDVLDKEFASLKRIFEEAGASAEEYAELEKLYGLERKRVLEETTSAMTSALRGLLDDLTVNNDALSLRDRLAMAKAKYDPLAADIAAGKKVDYDAFAEAARTFLDIQRQLSGSQSGYFTALGEVEALTRKAAAEQEAMIAGATGRATPFDKPSGGAASEPVVGAIDRLGDYLGGILTKELAGRLDALNDNVGRLVRQGGGASGGGGGGGSPAFAPFDRRRNF